MSAADYPISFPYGATSPPYSATKPHRGNDRACPSGTALVVGGATIGATGNTGASTGPHLHIQEWNTGYSNTRKPQNEFQGGTVINIDPTGTQGDGSFGKFITIQTADGWKDTYAHLSRIDVKIGDIIGGNMQQEIDELQAQMSGVYKQLDTLNAQMGGVYTQLDESRAREADLQKQINDLETGNLNGTYNLTKVDDV